MSFNKESAFMQMHRSAKNEPYLVGGWWARVLSHENAIKQAIFLLFWKPYIISCKVKVW